MTQMIQAWVDEKETWVEKLEVHQRGLRHKAVSVFLFDGGKVLLQQRALAKYHTPGLWANACCTHPAKGETPLDCANRRVAEELNIKDLDLSFVDTVEYRADVGSGLVEHEVVDIFCGQFSSSSEIIPNPSEVAQTRWMTLETLEHELRQKPLEFTPWLKIYFEKHREKIVGCMNFD